MSRYLGIDHGEKNVGLALSCPMKSFARAYKTISNDKNLFINLISECQDNEIVKVVVGLPVSFRTGQDTDQTRIVREFADKLSSFLKNIEVVFYDERLTSKIYEDMPKECKGKGLRDAISAQLILQSYLDKNTK